MKLWGGRFEKSTNDVVDDFPLVDSPLTSGCTGRTSTDPSPMPRMLGEQGIIPKEDADAIVAGPEGYPGRH